MVIGRLSLFRLLLLGPTVYGSPETPETLGWKVMTLEVLDMHFVFKSVI